MTERRRVWYPLKPLTLAGILAMGTSLGGLVVYYRWSRWHHWLPPAIHRLFWTLVCVGLLFGLGVLVAPFIPPRWKRWWPSVGRNRVSIPREGIGFLLIMGVLFVGASLTQSNTLLLVFAAMAGPFVVNGSVAYTMLKNARVLRKTPRRAMVGELFSVQVDLQNPMSMMSLWMMVVHDQLTCGDQTCDPTVLFTRVAPGTVQSGHYQMQLWQRGRHKFGPVQVTSRFPLGLIERGNVFREFSEMLIYPRIGRLSPHWKRRLMGASELIETPQPRTGVFEDEYHHLREYRTGDNPRAIHWRSSARRNTLIVREYQQNREHHLLLVIDLWGHVHSQGDEAKLIEQTLSLAATICCEHRKSCRGATLTVIGCGKEQWRWEARANSSALESLLDRLAVIQPTLDNDFGNRLTEATAHVTPGTRMVIVSTRREVDGMSRFQGSAQTLASLPTFHWLSTSEPQHAALVIYPEDRRSPAGPAASASGRGIATAALQSQGTAAPTTTGVV